MKCTVCGRKTHYASSCYAKKRIDGSIIEIEDIEESDSSSSSDEEEETCDRCGRISHTSDVCYAKKTIDGDTIDDEEEEEVESRGVYTLELGNGKYYVGKSENVDSRIGSHEHGAGAAWTKLHGVVGEIATITPHMDDLESWERCETLAMGLKYGIENVRGHLWTRINLPYDEIQSFEAQVCERMDFCRKCGRGNHMVAVCRSNTKAKWMSEKKPPPKKRKIVEKKSPPKKRTWYKKSEKYESF